MPAGSYTITLDSSFVTAAATPATGTVDARYFHLVYRGMSSGKLMQVVHTAAMV